MRPDEPSNTAMTSDSDLLRKLSSLNSYIFWLARKWMVRVFSGTSALNVPSISPGPGFCTVTPALTVEMKSP